MDRDMQFLLVLLAVIGLLALFIILPVLEFVLLSIILAYVLFPVHKRLREYVGSFVSAIALIAASIVAIIVPIAYVLWVFSQDLERVAAGESSIEINQIETRIEELTGIEIELADSTTEIAEASVDILFGGVAGIITTAFQFVLGIALVLFLVFYLLREGEDFVAWVEALTPLPPEDTDRLFEKVNKTMWGSVIGHTFAAIVQAIIAGLGLWIAGVSSVVFWTVVMAILAFLPLIGAFLVWAPASVYLIITNQTAAGIFLFIYGMTIVSMIDYYVRPLVIDREARLNPGVILAGVFGGIYTFGFVGLFVGPITIGVLAATLQTIKSKQEAEQEGESTAKSTPGVTSDAPAAVDTEGTDPGSDEPTEAPTD